MVNNHFLGTKLSTKYTFRHQKNKFTLKKEMLWVMKVKGDADKEKGKEHWLHENVNIEILRIEEANMKLSSRRRQERFIIVSLVPLFNFFLQLYCFLVFYCELESLVWPSKNRLIDSEPDQTARTVCLAKQGIRWHFSTCYLKSDLLQFSLELQSLNFKSKPSILN